MLLAAGPYAFSAWSILGSTDTWRHHEIPRPRADNVARQNAWGLCCVVGGTAWIARVYNDFAPNSFDHRGKICWNSSNSSFNFMTSISLVPRRSRLGQSWTLPWAVTSPRDTRRSPALSQTSHGQRVKRERLGTRLDFYVLLAAILKHEKRLVSLRIWWQRQVAVG